LPIAFVTIYLIIHESTHTLLGRIVVNGQTATSAFHTAV